MAKAASSKPAPAKPAVAARPAAGAAARAAAKPAAPAAKPAAAKTAAAPAAKPATTAAKPATAKPPANKPASSGAKPAGPKTSSPLRAAIAGLIDEAREAAPVIRPDDVVLAQLLDIYDRENAKAPLLLRLVSGKTGDGQKGPYASLSYAVVEPEIAQGQILSHYHGFHDTDWGISQRTGEHRVHTAQDSLNEIFSDLRNCGVDVDGVQGGEKLTVDIIDEDFSGYIKRAVARGVIGVRARATFNNKKPPGRLNFDILAPAGVLFQEVEPETGGMDVQTPEDEQEEPGDQEENVETTEEQEEETVEETVEEQEETQEEGSEEEPEGVQLGVDSEVEFTIRDKTYEGVVTDFTEDQKSAFIQIEGEANPRKVKIQAITMIDGVEVDFTGA